ncbi:MAG TPA: transglycosylase domain-containing protein, partial [Solirubrobacteraceae bacterium]|nr:transglycosylase domain-containing protein [Solirubrobacteraceae bacterium]
MSRLSRERRRRKRRGVGPIFLVLGVLVTVATLGGLGAVGYVVALANSAPELSELKAVDQGASSEVFAADGSTLGFIQSSVLRQPIPSTSIPDTMKDATVAIEDERFYRHEGVDFEGVVRAAVKNIESGGTVEGGSTLTMQLVRTLYISKERTFKRKLHEAKLAEELENVRDKRWILNKYINNVPYGTVGGQELIGVQAAARAYFDKPARKLALHESAMLAGMPQAPSQYNPFEHPELAERRRNQVLRKMAELGMVKPSTAEAAIARPLGVKESEYYTKRRESFFFDYVRQELIDKYGAERVRRGGLKIYTTVDLNMQRKAREAISSVLSFPNAPKSAIVTVSPKTGKILAMASSASYAETKFNLAAQGHRQPGSTFKVMGLMAALERGVSPEGTSYTSKPLKFNDPKYGPIETKTYDGTYGGRMNLVKATLKSDNAVYMQLALDLGPDAVKDAARQMGIKSKLNGYPAEILGGLEDGVSPLEMANAYATIASGGWRNRPIAIEKVRFADGHTENLGKPRRHRAFQDGVTAKATDILQQNVTSGTGTKAQIGCPAAGKTGTTDNHVDAWFAGYTPNLSTAVWVGFPTRRVEMYPPVTPISVAGGTYPSEIWGRYMKAVKKGCGDFAKPKTAFKAAPFFGKYASTGAPGGGDDDDQTGTNGTTPGAGAAGGGTTGGGTTGDGTTGSGTGGGGNGG